MNNEHVNDYYKRTINEKNITIKPQKSYQYIIDKNKGREDLIAFSEGENKISYGEMYEKWDQVAKVLSGYDMWRGNNSRILVLMPNVAQTGMFNYGSDMTGAVVDYIDPTSSYEKIEKYIKTENITDIISLDLLLAKNVGNKVEKLKKEYGLKNIIVYRDMYMNSLMPGGIKLYSSIKNIANKFSKYVTRYDDAVRNTINTQIKKDTLDGSGLDFITHTSGTTTGIGKPIPLSDHNRNSLVNEYKLAKFDYDPGMTMMHFIPYFAGYGTVNTAHLGLSNGLELQEIPLFTPVKFSEYILTYKPNVVVATTPCWLSLINSPLCQNIDLSFLKLAATGGSPTSIDDEIKVNSFLKSHGANCKMVVGYGMSEFAGCVITDTQEYNTLGKTGVPLPGVEIKIRDTNTNEIHDYSEPNIQGEALIHSETMSSGILDGKEVIPTIEIDGKKFIATHDIMKADEFGQFEYVGRTDGMFQRYDGYNVYPLHIEKFFKALDCVDDCCLVWEKDELKNGNIPKIYLQLSENIEDKEQLMKQIIDNAFINENMKSKYIVNFRDLPHKWIFVDNLPKNTMGKTDLHKLLSQQVDGEDYELDVEEDNTGIKSYTINCNKKVR